MMALAAVLAFATGTLAVLCVREFRQCCAREVPEDLAAVARAIELRFPSMRGNTARIARFSNRIARELKLPMRTRRRLREAVTVRDVGSSQVPYRLLNRTEPARWSPEERSHYEAHSRLGADMLADLPQAQGLAEVVRHHHSRYDEHPEAPIEARVIAVASDFVWNLTTDGERAARLSLMMGRGTEFDPQVVDAMLAVLISDRAKRIRRTAAA